MSSSPPTKPPPLPTSLPRSIQIHVFDTVFLHNQKKQFKIVWSATSYFQVRTETFLLKKRHSSAQRALIFIKWHRVYEAATNDSAQPKTCSNYWSLLTVLPTVCMYDFPLLLFELSSIIYNIISFYFLTYFSALA